VRCPLGTLSQAIVQDVYGSADGLRLSRIGKAIAAAGAITLLRTISDSGQGPSCGHRAPPWRDGRACRRKEARACPDRL